MTLYELGRIAASHETEMAHATLAAVAAALLDPECEWERGDGWGEGQAPRTA